MSRGPDVRNRLPTIRDVLARGHLRLVLFAIALASIGLTLTGGVLLREYSHLNLNLAARTLSYAVEPAVYFGDLGAVEEAVRSIDEPGNARRIEVVSAVSGATVVWEPHAGQDGRALFSAADALIWPNPVEVPVVSSGGDRIGSVRVFGNSERLVIYMMAGIVIGLCCIGLTILATRMLARRLDEDVLNPLKNIADVARKVARDRDFARRAKASNIAELDSFSSDFNSLLDELEGWHDGVVSENQALAHRANHDTLTGLGNRFLFEKEIARRIQAERPFDLLFVDIDRLKQINDKLGHASGDAVIAAVGERLKGHLRARDQAFRLGGDEFAIIVEPDRKNLNAEVVCNRIFEAITPPIALEGGGTIDATVSMGIASYPLDAADAQSLLNTADERMYAQKNGRGTHAG